MCIRDSAAAVRLNASLAADAPCPIPHQNGFWGDGFRIVTPAAAQIAALKENCGAHAGAVVQAVTQYVGYPRGLHLITPFHKESCLFGYMIAHASGRECAEHKEIRGHFYLPLP